jgi:hypothetical protein
MDTIKNSNKGIWANMKLTSLFKGVKKATIKLSENQLFSVRGKHIKIHCLYGDLWITWPKRGERILKSGQTFLISSRGKVCIMALSNAFFRVEIGRWSTNVLSYEESDERIEETDVFPIPLETFGFISPTEKT